MIQRFDVVIVGGGILGAFHAYHACLKGLSVALLEKNAIPQGSSVRNFGQVVPSGMNRRWQILGRQSVSIYRSIHAKFDISLRENGSVYLASNKEEMTLLEELAKINHAEDYPSHLLTAAECRKRYAGLRSDYCVGGLFFPEEVTLEPRVALSRILMFLVEQHRLHYAPNTLVNAIENKGSHCLVESADGRQWEADRVLVCNGFEFQILYPALFAKSDLQSVKIQMLQLVPQGSYQLPGSILTGLSIRRYEAFQECPSYAAIKALEDPDSFERQWGIHILFKQSTDGSIILGDSHEYADAAQADQLGFDLHEHVNEFMLKSAKTIFDLPNWQVKSSWYGIYSQCKGQELYNHLVDDRTQIITGIGGKGMTGSAGYAAQFEF